MPLTVLVKRTCTQVQSCGHNHNYVLLTQAVGIERQKTFTNYVEILRFIQLVIVCFDATNLLDSYLQWCDITDDGFAKNSQWTWLYGTRPMRRGTSLDSQHKFTDVTLELGGKVVLSLVLIFFSLFSFFFNGLRSRLIWILSKIELRYPRTSLTRNCWLIRACAPCPHRSIYRHPFSNLKWPLGTAGKIIS